MNMYPRPGKRSMFVISCAFSAVVAFLAVLRWSGPRAPTIRFDAVFHDAGILRGTVPPQVRHRFTFWNSGRQPLVISSVKTNCGCTVAELREKTIPPGKTGHLDVTLHLAQLGVASQDILVFSNAANSPTQLTLYATWRPPTSIDVVPRKVVFEPTGTDRIVKLTVTALFDDPARAVALDRISAEKGRVAARVVGTHDYPGRTTTGYLRRTFDVEVSETEQHTGSLDDLLSLHFLPPLQYSPPQIAVSGSIGEDTILEPHRVVLIFAEGDDTLPTAHTIRIVDAARTNRGSWIITDNPFEGWLEASLGRRDASGEWELKLVPRSRPAFARADDSIRIAMREGGKNNPLSLPIAVRTVPRQSGK